jgi:hypothetical protein
MHTKLLRNYLRYPHQSTVLALSLFCAHSHGADISTLQLLGQSEFRQLSEDLGAALSFKPLIPAESLGITGFDLGLSATATKLGERGVWRKATANSDLPGYLIVPSLRLHKGLPFDIDIGATATIVPSSNIRIYGGELRWAVLPGSTVTPALALRASFTALNGVEQLGMRTMGLDASISKGFAFLTPYAGIGSVHVSSKPSSATGLAKTSFYRTKIFVGANLNFGLLNFAGEADRTGDISSYGIKMGFRF